jgi:hypothetical protein
MNSDDKFLKAMLEAPVSVGRHVTQFQFVVADGIARRSPWLTAGEIVRDTKAVVCSALEYAMRAEQGSSGTTSVLLSFQSPPGGSTEAPTPCSSDAVNEL